MERTVVVALHPHRAQAREAFVRLCRLLQERGIRPVVSADEFAEVSRTLSVEADTLELEIVQDSLLPRRATESELIVVLGGDGTILRSAERFHSAGIPIMGVNLGHVGFLAETEPDDLQETVDKIAHADYYVEHRLTLDVVATYENEVIHRAWALNEATVQKGGNTQMIELAVGVDNRPVSTFGCDGVILATPTGSTAYAFSAGGPIVWPEVEALLMVPISPHALFSKPLVVGPNSRISVEFIPRPTPDSALLWCDGRAECGLPQGSRVEVTRSASTLKFARLHRGPFTERIVAKFQLPVTGWRGAS